MGKRCVANTAHNPIQAPQVNQVLRRNARGLLKIRIEEGYLAWSRSLLGSIFIMPIRYRLLRGLIRIWVRFFFRKIRCLNPQALPDSGAAMLIAGHPGGFLDALLLVTAFERQIHCLLDRQFLRSPWRRLFGGFLNMIPYEPEGPGFQPGIEQACEALSQGHALLVFAVEQVVKPGEPSTFYSTCASIALQAESRGSGALGLEIFPIQLFLPVAQLYSSELLIHVDTPLIPREYLEKGTTLAEQVRALARAAESACARNDFSLQPEDVHNFLSDLEEVLLAELQEDWAARPNWKQKVDGFELSRFTAEWVDQLNRLHPGQLAALRDLVDTYREARRRCALGELEADQAGAWMNISWRRVAAWTESVLGLPLALFGAINYLLPGLILYFAGLLNIKDTERQTVKWVMRGLVLIGCCAVQILLCAQEFGRTIAGYYVLTLPVSGAYLWRYTWLLRRRTRLLLLERQVRAETGKLARMRKDLIREINGARDQYVEMMGLTH
jgi:1-acyl-sn-glycerol-3-phosphate acyltransferase